MGPQAVDAQFFSSCAPAAPPLGRALPAMVQTIRDRDDLAIPGFCGPAAQHSATDATEKAPCNFGSENPVRLTLEGSPVGDEGAIAIGIGGVQVTGNGVPSRKVQATDRWCAPKEAELSDPAQSVPSIFVQPEEAMGGTGSDGSKSHASRRQAPSRDSRYRVSAAFRQMLTSFDVEGNSDSDSNDEPTVYWQWKHRTGWRNYDPKVCKRIEAAFQRGEPYVRLKSGKVGTVPMEIFFREMIQHDPITGNLRPVQRAGGLSCMGKAWRKLMEWRLSVETGKPTHELFEDYQKRRKALIDSIDEPRRESSAFWKPVEESRCTRIVMSTWFNAISAFFVIANAVYIGIDAEWNDAETITEADGVYQFMNHAFCTAFSLELAVRYGAFRHCRDAIRDGWLLFDTLLVVLLVLETWVLAIFQAISGTDLLAGASKFALLRLVRLARLTRLGRLARLMRMVPELMTLLVGIATALRSVCFTLVLLGVLLFCFGVIFKNMSDGNDALEQLFPTLGVSIWHLLLHGVFLDGVSDPLNTIADESYLLAGVFFLFIVASSFTVMNLLIGILCEVVHQVTANEKEETAVNFLKGNLLKILECHDKDDDRHIMKEEFDLIMKNPEIHIQLTQFGVDVHDLIALKEVLFDEKRIQYGKEGESQGPDLISFGAFTEMVLRLRGGNSARVKDVVELRDYMQKRMDELESKVICHCAAGDLQPVVDASDTSYPQWVRSVDVQQDHAQIQMLLSELRAGHRAMREELDFIKAAFREVRQRHGTPGQHATSPDAVPHSSDIAFSVS